MRIVPIIEVPGLPIIPMKPKTMAYGFAFLGNALFAIVMAIATFGLYAEVRSGFFSSPISGIPQTPLWAFYTTIPFVIVFTVGAVFFAKKLINIAKGNVR